MINQERLADPQVLKSLARLLAMPPEDMIEVGDQGSRVMRPTAEWLDKQFQLVAQLPTELLRPRKHMPQNWKIRLSQMAKRAIIELNGGGDKLSARAAAKGVNLHDVMSSSTAPAVLCPAHRNMNPEYVHEIFYLVTREVSQWADPVRRHMRHARHEPLSSSSPSSSAAATGGGCPELDSEDDSEQDDEFISKGLCRHHICRLRAIRDWGNRMTGLCAFWSDPETFADLVEGRLGMPGYKPPRDHSTDDDGKKGGPKTRPTQKSPCVRAIPPSQCMVHLAVPCEVCVLAAIGAHSQAVVDLLASLISRQALEVYGRYMKRDVRRHRQGKPSASGSSNLSPREASQRARIPCLMYLVNEWAAQFGWSECEEIQRRAVSLGRLIFCVRLCEVRQRRRQDKKLRVRPHNYYFPRYIRGSGGKSSRPSILPDKDKALTISRYLPARMATKHCHLLPFPLLPACDDTWCEPDEWTDEDDEEALSAIEIRTDRPYTRQRFSAVPEPLNVRRPNQKPGQKPNPMPTVPESFEFGTMSPEQEQSYIDSLGDFFEMPDLDDAYERDLLASGSLMETTHEVPDAETDEEESRARPYVEDYPDAGPSRPRAPEPPRHRGMPPPAPDAYGGGMHSPPQPMYVPPVSDPYGGMYPPPPPPPTFVPAPFPDPYYGGMPGGGMAGGMYAPPPGPEYVDFDDGTKRYTIPVFLDSAEPPAYSRPGPSGSGSRGPAVPSSSRDSRDARDSRDRYGSRGPSHSHNQSSSHSRSRHGEKPPPPLSSQSSRHGSSSYNSSNSSGYNSSGSSSGNSSGNSSGSRGSHSYASAPSSSRPKQKETSRPPVHERLYDLSRSRRESRRTPADSRDSPRDSPRDARDARNAPRDSPRVYSSAQARAPPASKSGLPPNIGKSAAYMADSGMRVHSSDRSSRSGRDRDHDHASAHVAPKYAPPMYGPPDHMDTPPCPPSPPPLSPVSPVSPPSPPSPPTRSARSKGKEPEYAYGTTSDREAQYRREREYRERCAGLDRQRAVRGVRYVTVDKGPSSARPSRHESTRSSRHESLDSHREASSSRHESTRTSRTSRCDNEYDEKPTHRHGGILTFGSHDKKSRR